MVAAQAPEDDRSLEDRRKLGAFYTPERLSQILTRWAIRSGQDTVLEPSFGGCGFLHSARERLLELGCRDAKANIYGCDIDPLAFQYLANVLGVPVDLKRFVKGDFLNVAPDQDWPLFTSILANPPYIPYQSIDKELRSALSSRKFLIDGIGGRASLWAYFVAHSLYFLAPGGRMAWVLPGAFLQADYAKPIRNYLSTSFSRSAAIVLRERIFLDEGTDEETIVLLAEGHLSKNNGLGIELAEAKTLPDLIKNIEKWDNGLWKKRQSIGRPATLSIDDEQEHQLRFINSLNICTTVGKVASVQIGLVTGANKFFVLSRVSVEQARLLEDDCTAILAKFQSAQGISYTASDHKLSVAAGVRNFLVGRNDVDPNDRLLDYFATFGEKDRKHVSTFQKRKLWWKPNDGRIPDAFFPVMHHYGPRIVLNPDCMTSTNTIHRVYFKDETPLLRRKLIAISMLTSFSQLSAELVGRRYGSGVLKHEPREAEKINILLPDVRPTTIETAFDRIDKSQRSGDRGEATWLADALIFEAAGIQNWAKVSERLNKTLLEVRARRRPQSRIIKR